MVPCLQPLDLRVSPKLIEKNMNYRLIYVSFLKGSQLFIDDGLPRFKKNNGFSLKIFWDWNIDGNIDGMT